MHERSPQLLVFIRVFYVNKIAGSNCGEVAKLVSCGTRTGIEPGSCHYNFRLIWYFLYSASQYD